MVVCSGLPWFVYVLVIPTDTQVTLSQCLLYLSCVRQTTSLTQTQSQHRVTDTESETETLTDSASLSLSDSYHFLTS